MNPITVSDIAGPQPEHFVELRVAGTRGLNQDCTGWDPEYLGIDLVHLLACLEGHYLLCKRSKFSGSSLVWAVWSHHFNLHLRSISDGLDPKYSAPYKMLFEMWKVLHNLLTLHKPIVKKNKKIRTSTADYVARRESFLELVVT